MAVTTSCSGAVPAMSRTMSVANTRARKCRKAACSASRERVDAPASPASSRHQSCSTLRVTGLRASFASLASCSGWAVSRRRRAPDHCRAGFNIMASDMGSACDSLGGPAQGKLLRASSPNSRGVLTYFKQRHAPIDFEPLVGLGATLVRGGGLPVFRAGARPADLALWGAAAHRSLAPADCPISFGGVGHRGHAGADSRGLARLGSRRTGAGSAPERRRRAHAASGTRRTGPAELEGLAAWPSRPAAAAGGRHVAGRGAPG
ncbi:hypothetical protein CDEF62S_04320 [Castellaniella defragrans]